LLSGKTKTDGYFRYKAYLFSLADNFSDYSKTEQKTGINGLKYDLNGTREGGTWHWPAGPRYAVRGIYSAKILPPSLRGTA